ncbi:MAG: hypothetical protein PVF34_11660 [Gammaproteobacteria bacterium]|jgi:hypothetical protein
MKLLVKIFQIACIGVFAVTLLACSKSDEGQDKEHFASTQQKALEKAKAVDGMLQDAEAKKREQLENMSR